MKNIILTGSKGYLSTSLKNFFNGQRSEFRAKSISLKDKKWKNNSFNNIDVVIHCAALVHKNEKNFTLEDYMEINSELTLELAKKCKDEGVKHFIFFSTMSVYGVDCGAINKDTKPRPTTYYGKSKLNAEKILLELASENFIISILRPPMIYGRNSPGNYKRLSSFSKIALFFPEIKNKRSILFIKNLEIYVEEIIKKNISGIYHPQNNEYVSTIRLVEEIRNTQNNRTISIKWFNYFIMKLSKKNKTFNKLFGDLFYAEDIDQINFKNKLFDFEETIYISEVGLDKKHE